MNLLRYLVLFLLFPFSGLAAQPGNAIDWKYEIDLLARELAKRHPDLFFRTDSAWFYNEMNEVALETAGKSLFQVAVRLQQVVAVLGDAQTQVNYHYLVDKSLILPFEFYWFEDGICLMETDREHEGMLGKKLIAVNDVPIEVVVDSLSTLLVRDNDSVLKYNIPRMLPWYQLLEYFGFTGENEVSITVENRSGQEERYSIEMPVELGERLQVAPETMPMGWQDQNTYFRDHYFESEKLFFIQYNRCWSREVEEDFGSGASALFMPSFKEFEKGVISVLKRKKIDKLVFDLRFNRGGNAAQGTEFITRICELLSKKNTEIFVLIGRTTFASAVINTVDLMECRKVVLVGEETSGRPDHFGEVKRFVLPESKLIVSYSTTYFSLLKGDPPSIKPDLPAPMDYDQYIHGIDPAMVAVRLHNLP
jgi:hypothetical protein